MDEGEGKRKNEDGSRVGNWVWAISNLITDQYPRLPATQQPPVLALAARWQSRSRQPRQQQPDPLFVSRFDSPVTDFA